MSDESRIVADASKYEEILALFANVAPETPVEIRIRVRAGRAREVILSGWRGPDDLSTSQCEMFIGGSRSMWRAACLEGLIEGARKKGKGKGGDWALPNDAARRYYAGLKSTGDNAGEPKQVRRGSAVSRSLPAHARGRRGPRKAALAVVKGGQP